jgi:hypothetical protein
MQTWQAKTSGVALKAVCVVIALSVGGCGQQSVHYAMLPVEGTVTLAGEPLAGAELMFDSADGPRGFGVSDEAGRFTVTTRQYGAGLPAGSYRVFVTGSEKTRLGRTGRAIQVATIYGESGVGRVSIDPQNLSPSFDLEEKPRGNRPNSAGEDPGGA